MSRARRRAGVLTAALVVVAACTSSGPATPESAPDPAPLPEPLPEPVPEPTGDDAPDPAEPADVADVADETDATADSGPALSEWTACGRAAQCAVLQVPLDHADPGGAKIGIDLIRRPATGERVGTLVVNPGGPGASGVDFLAFGDAVPDEAAARFDQVSFDPRGIRGSNPLDCRGELVAFYALDHSPDDATEAAALDDAARAAADSCATSGGELLEHLSTVDVARDIDLLRAALGEDQISYVGFSYGTLLGQHYADLFPDRVRAMVLDGVVDPEVGVTGLLSSQAVALGSLVDRIFADCAGVEPCLLDDPAATLATLLDASERGDGPSDDGSPLGPAEIVDAVVFASYDPATYRSLIEALSDGSSGDGRLLSVLANAYRDFEGWDVYTAYSCIDSPPPPDPAAFAEFAADLEAETPLLGAAIANELLPCAYWPTVPRGTPAPITADGAATILVVGNTGDVATPYESAVVVTESLADAVLLTYMGEGHTSLGRSDCVDEVVVRYLVDLELPEPDTTCP